MNGRVEFRATYYDGESSRPSPVVVTFEPERLAIRFSEDARRAPHYASRLEVKIGSRLGNTPRSLRIGGEALLETEDNDAVDLVERAWGTSALRPHFFESSFGIAVASLVLIAALGGALFVWGLPYFARKVAFSMSDEFAYKLGAGTLESLDRIMFHPTNLPSERQAELRKGFAKMAERYPKLPLHLEFRRASMPNAFALPNGTVVVTDELVEKMRSDDEIFAILAHEIGHVENRHTARMALETSVAGLFMMVVVGDASQAAGLAGALPAIYANATFSQQHESEADTFALEFMKKANMDPADFASGLERLAEEYKESEKSNSFTRYASSHPPTAERVAKFRKASKGTSDNEGE